MKLCKYTLLLFFLFLHTVAYCGTELLVQNIIASGTGKNPIIAQNKALKSSEEQAFILASYFLYSQLQPSIHGMFTSEEITRTVKRFEVIHEEIFDSEYKALVNYYFDADKLINLLSSMDIELYGDYQYSNFMIIPVSYSIDNEFIPTIWETKWFEAWQSVKDDYSFFVIPESIENVSKIKIDHLSDFQYNYLLKQHNPTEILISSIKYKNDSKFEVTIERPIAKQSKIYYLSNDDSQDIEDFFKESINEILSSLYDNLSSIHVSVIEGNDFYCQLTITDIKEWNKIKRIIANYDYVIHYISNNLIVVEMRNESNVYFVEKDIRKAGYYIKKVNENQWIVDKIQ